MGNLKEDLIQANTNPIKMASFITKTVNNGFRQKVLNLLLTNDRLSVNELCDKLNTEQSVMSQHLAILRKAGLVNTERDGKRIFYSVNESYLQDTINTILQLSREVVKQQCVIFVHTNCTKMFKAHLHKLPTTNLKFTFAPSL